MWRKNSICQLALIVLALLFAGSGGAVAKSIRLTWDSSSDPAVTGYKVYYKAGNSTLPLTGTGATQGTAPINVGKVTSYDLTGLADSEIHYFAVTAYNSTGVESLYSNMVSAAAKPIAVNRAPVFSAIGAKTVNEGALLTFAISASDPDGNPLTYSGSGLPAGATFSAATRTFTWTPGHTQAGTHSVSFTVSDGLVQVATAVSITVVNVNRAPTLASITAKTVNEGSPLSFTVSATDPDGDNLTYTATGLPTGAAFSTATRTFSWTPGYADAGVHSVTFTVTDGTMSANQPVSITVTDLNRTPVISGAPATAIIVGTAYSFVPVASDPDGDPLTFSVVNKPTWMSFDSATGRLSGTPGTSHVGATSGISLRVSDGKVTASLPSFSLSVTADPQADSDGDGVIDSEDAFPNDPDRSKFAVSASATPGGYIAPAGVSEVAPGANQKYFITPGPGFTIQDVQIDGQSVGAVDNYLLENIRSDRSITASFSPAPGGLSIPATDTGLPGVIRADGGNDSDNLVNGKPSLDVDYQFQVTLRDFSATVQRVMLLLDGYPYEMKAVSGTASVGITYALTLQLGPATNHWYRFEAHNASGAATYRLPATGDWDGPAVRLLNGVNQISLPLDLAAGNITQALAFGSLQTKTWNPSTNSYVTLKSTDPVYPGVGYFIKPAAGMSLPLLNQVSYVTAASYDIPLQRGWNVIANPFGGQVKIADCKIRKDNDLPISWADATNNFSVINGLFAFQGQDWGNGYSFSAAGGTPEAALVPWRSYWIYLFKSDGNYVLTVTNPKP